MPNRVEMMCVVRVNISHVRVSWASQDNCGFWVVPISASTTLIDEVCVSVYNEIQHRYNEQIACHIISSNLIHVIFISSFIS